MTTDTQPITTETMLELLADPRRRTTLRHLQETGECDVAGLIETVDAGGRIPAGYRPGRDTETAVELYHAHLPKLAAAGVVEYDRTEGVVRYRSHDRLERLLQFLSTHLE